MNSSSKYAINKAKVNGKQVTMLFKERTWFGVGHCQGWYGAEFYSNAHVLAYFDDSNKEVVVCDLRYPKICIFSIYTEDRLHASTDEEAIEQFKDKCSSIE